MRADGVEIAQGDALHALVGRQRIAQNVLAHLLGVAVGRGRGLAGRLLRHGQLVGLAVNRTRRREDDVVTSELTHEVDDVHKRRKVVAVVFQRLADRLAHGLRRREMNHRVEVVLFEHFAKSVAVAAVRLFERHFDARDPADSLDGVHVAVREIIDDHHVVTGAYQFHGGMRTDITGAAAD